MGREHAHLRPPGSSPTLRATLGSCTPPRPAVGARELGSRQELETGQSSALGEEFGLSHPQQSIRE